MLDKNLYKFYLSYRINGQIHLEWVEGINLRHAKDKILFRLQDASDLMDWTNEKKEDLEKYLDKVKQSQEKKIENKDINS